MYETEANIAAASAESIPAEVLSLFSAFKSTVLARTLLPWGEHCTECVWPTCYKSCDLYTPRIDGGCRRFVDGMVRVACPEVLNGYLLKIRFKRWAKLWAPGNLSLRSVQDAQRIERRDRLVGTFLYQLPVPAALKKSAISKRYGMKKRIALRGERTQLTPTSFIVECFNPHNEVILLSISIRSFDAAQKIPFQRLLPVKPGAHILRIPVNDIAANVSLSSPFNIEIIPNDVDEETTLYFGLMEFVQERAHTKDNARDAENVTKDQGEKVKCVVWDLDNTLWNGVLVEDGLDGIRCRQRVVDVIRELDRRGILNSIASKNNHEDALRALQKFGIDDLFLCPQISWQPKGESVSKIAAHLNIGADTLLFVDDSEFELQQVKSSNPSVRIMNAALAETIPDLSECAVPVTEESMSRRKMYQVENTRKEVADGFKEDYVAFLRHCEIELQIGSLSADNLERVHELTQRTNQMNFSGNRYDREVLRGILHDPDLDTYVLSCKDRFGSYGIVGFALIDRREPRLTDLMFSCRIQSKRVEHAFLSFVLGRYIAETGKDFHANYRRTPRNAAAGQVFKDVGMTEVDIQDGITRLIFSASRAIPGDGLIKLNIERQAPLAAWGGAHK